MLDLSQLNVDRLRNTYWESQLKKIDPALMIRYDEIKQRWAIYEYYQENGFPKFLFWLEDRNGNAMEYNENYVRNKLDVMHQTWLLKQKLGTNKWFDSLEKEADRQHEELEEKERQESLYGYKHDRLQWRKGARELLNRPANDVFAGFQYNPPYKQKRGLNVKQDADAESAEIRGTESEGIQSDAGESKGSG